MTNADGHFIGLDAAAGRGFGASSAPLRADWLDGSLRRHGTRLAAQTTLILGDLLTYAIAFGILVELRYLDAGVPTLQRVCLLLAPLTVALYGFASLYPGYRLHHYEQMRRRLLAASTVGVVAGLIVAFAFGELRTASTIAAFLLLGLVLQFLLHPLLRSLLHRAGLWGEPAHIYAGAEKAQQLRAYFVRKWQYGIIPAEPAADPGIVIVATDEVPARVELEHLHRRYAQVILLANVPDMRISGLQPADLDGRIGLPLGEVVATAPTSPPRRAFDLLIAVPAVIAFAPVMLLAGVAIWLADPGPVIYRQPREGLRGRTVNVLKLRTMYRDAEERLEALLAADPEARAEWFAHFKLRNDPRVLPVVGKFLRSSSLDELPQLFNVIGGSMSVVGPRPFPDYHLEAMSSAFREKRASVTPGMTGLWQISERSDADIDLQQQLDEFYIENRSFWFDWYIIVNTVYAVFKRSGA